MWTAVVTTYLGALNTLFALFAGTCTQGDASRLFGGVISLPLFLAAVIGFSRTTRPILSVAICAPILPVIAWEGFEAARISIGLFSGIEACTILNGFPYWADGSEAFYAPLWALIALTIGGGTIFAVHQQLRKPSRARDY